MPKLTIDDVTPSGVPQPFSYHLLPLDEKGQERPSPDGTRVSDAIAEELETMPVTDVFVFSHGWLTDLERAKKTYAGWLRAAVGGGPARDQVEKQRTDFRPLLIGLHWPSMPGGYEDADGLLDYDLASGSDADVLKRELGWACETPESHEALSKVVTCIERPVSERAELFEALQVLVDELLPVQDGLAGAPGADIDRIDSESLFRAASDDVVEDEMAEKRGGATAYGAVGTKGGDPVRRACSFLSFWSMKLRARTVGEQGGAFLLTTIHQSALRDVRIHLIGHSYGAIVVTAALAKALEARPSLRRAHSMVLLQGAMSLWSFATQLPGQPSKHGYFHPVLRDELVAGPIVTTRSKHDLVLQWPYRIAARLGGRHHVEYRPGLPVYGAVGQYGIAGAERARSQPMADPDATYDLACGYVYNLEASAYISKHRKIGPLRVPADAHSYLSHPAVAHAVWSGALASDG